MMDKIEGTVRTFILSFLKAGLYAILAISIIGIMGVPMASVVAVLASAGVAIGLALQGALSNLAGGIMLMIFKPFHQGDYVSAAGVEGVVKEVTLFYTVILTLDNKRITVPNGSLMNANITDYSAEELRRVDLRFACAKSEAPAKIQDMIRDKNQRRVPKEEWYIRENAHEAIVTKDEYEQAQEAIQRRRKFARSSHDQSDRVYFCAHCGGKLEKANGTVFACPSHRYHDGSPCENVRWRKSALEEIVFEALKRQIEIVSIESAAVRKTTKSKGESLERQLVLLKAQYDACDREKFTIYENYREGKLTPEEYLSGKDALAQKQAALKDQLESCETQLEVFHQQSLDAEEQHEAASRMTGLPDDKLREHLYDAVERILVYDTETIEIVWRFNESKIDTDENIGVAK